MNKDPILRVCTKIIVGPIILFGLYVQFHGDYGPGGGFQAGVIVAAGFILHSLIFGLSEGRRLITQKLNIFINLHLKIELNSKDKNILKLRSVIQIWD